MAATHETSSHETRGRETRAQATTRPIRSKVGAKMIAQSDRLFDSSVASIAVELIQNARRAGARKVVATRRGSTLVFADDGPGIAAEDADVLLTLGGSANEAELDRLEQAAGIGFFCLASHDVVVESRDWTMSVPAEAFTGRADATLTRRATSTPGLSVSVAALIDDDDLRRSAAHVAKTLAGCARYSGLTLELEGFATEPGKAARSTFPPASFLDHHKHYEDHVDVELPGATVRVCRGRDDRGSHRMGALNFHGHLVEDVAKLGIAFPNELEVATVSSGRIATSRPSTFVLIDVRTVETVALKLPERNAIIENGAAAKLREAAAAGYAALLKRPGMRNGLPMGHPLRTAHPDIPPCDILVRACADDGHLRTGDYAAATLPDGTRALLRADGTRIDPGEPLLHDGVPKAFALAAGEVPALHRLDDHEAAFGKGGRRLAHATLVTRSAGEEAQSAPFGPDDLEYDLLPPEIAAEDPYATLCGGEAGDAGPVGVDDIDLIVSTTRGSESGGDVVLPLACVAWGEHGMTDEPLLVVSRRHAGSAVAAAMAFVPWEDDERSEAENDASEKHHRERFSELVARVSGEEHLVILERIRRYAADQLAPYMRQTGCAGFDIDLEIRPGDGWWPDAAMDARRLAHEEGVDEAPQPLG